MRFCPVCNQNKDLDSFYKRKASKDGYFRECEVCTKEMRNDYYKKNRDKIIKQKSEYYKNNSDEIKKKRKIYVKNNYEEVISKSIQYEKERSNKDPLFKIRKRLKTRVYQAFKRTRWKRSSSYDIVKQHIEQQFQEGMSWDNHGKWHIDHIIPLASAKTEKELHKLCHYKNLQPLWAIDNILKSDKIC